MTIQGWRLRTKRTYKKGINTKKKMHMVLLPLCNTKWAV